LKISSPDCDDRIRSGIPKREKWSMSISAPSWSGRRHPSSLIPTLAIVLLVGPGCASPGKLAEYEFRDRTVGVVSLGSPRPEVLTDAILDVNFSNPLQAALRIGADVVKEVEASRARTRLDSASVEADVSGRMMHRVLHGVAGELRAVPVEDARTAEFELEIVIRRYGIDADTWTAPVHFFIESEAVLREAATGRRIWREKVTEREPITTVVVGAAASGWQEQAVVNDIITGAGLASLSPEAMVRMLEGLADFSSDRILRSFRRGLEKSRNGATNLL
jgi:hypothetical protein